MKNENIIFYAFRYALGRRTYAVGDVVECIKNNWTNLKKSTQEKIKKEIIIAIKRDEAGMECDKKQWQEILKLN